MKSLSRSSSSRPTRRTPSCGGAGRLDVRVVGDQPGPERGHPLGEQHADAAEPDHADGLALHLDAGVLGPLPLAGLERGARRAAVLRATASSSATACSAAETMLEVGALTTMTPRAVAAGTSTLSRPTPARATTFSRGAAAIASASIWVALRTITRVGLGERGEQRRAVGAVDVTDVEVVGEHLDGGGGELFGDQHHRAVRREGHTVLGSQASAGVDTRGARHCAPRAGRRRGRADGLFRRW